MKYNLKEQLFDKIGGLELVNPDEYGAKYNKGVREAKARVVSFFNKELVSEVPQCVIDWYEENKGSLDYSLWNFIMDWDYHKNSDFKEWLNSNNNAFQTLVNMHQFGYKIKTEKRYSVKIKGVVTNSKSLKHNTNLDKWYMGRLDEFEDVKTYHTKEDLIEGGFEWVFSCEGVEVDEVTE